MNIRMLLCFLVATLNVSAYATTRILMMIPNDFMWSEYNEPRKLYEQAGFQQDPQA